LFDPSLSSRGASMARAARGAVAPPPAGHRGPTSLRNRASYALKEIPHGSLEDLIGVGNWYRARIGRCGGSGGLLR
jgi:hypothetical protein